MGIKSTCETIYCIECDCCGRRSHNTFHKLTAIATAKKKGWLRFELMIGTNSEVVWVCSGCSKSEVFLKSLREYLPKTVAPFNVPALVKKSS